MSLVRLESNSLEENLNHVIGHVYNIYIHSDYRNPYYYHVRRECLISEWEIKKVLPGYKGKTICFSYDYDRWWKEANSIDIYEINFPKYVQTPMREKNPVTDVEISRDMIKSIVRIINLKKEMSNLKDETLKFMREFVV